VVKKTGMKFVAKRWSDGRATADFALLIVNTAGRPARQGSADELAVLGLDRLPCLLAGIKYQGEASLRIHEMKKGFTAGASSWKSFL
jgi:hypothetical protein